MRKRLLVRGRLCLLALALLLACLPALAQSAARQKEVKIYLVNTADEPAENDLFGLQAVSRRVDGRSPLRATLLALVAGPTAAEEARGLASSTYGIRLVSVKLKGGVAYANFTQPRGTGFPGDLAPGAFKEAVTRTATQFPGVRRAVVCLDGVLNFGDESGGPRKKCPKV